MQRQVLQLRATAEAPGAEQTIRAAFGVEYADDDTLRRVIQSVAHNRSIGSSVHKHPVWTFGSARISAWLSVLKAADARKVRFVFRSTLLL